MSRMKVNELIPLSPYTGTNDNALLTITNARAQMHSTRSISPQRRIVNYVYSSCTTLFRRGLFRRRMHGANLDLPHYWWREHGRRRSPTRPGESHKSPAANGRRSGAERACRSADARTGSHGVRRCAASRVGARVVGALYEGRLRYFHYIAAAYGEESPVQLNSVHHYIHYGAHGSS